MPHTDQVAISRRSSRPGNGLADSLFNVTFTRPLSLAESTLIQADLCYRVPPAPEGAPRFTKGRDVKSVLSDVSFVDDALFAVQARADEMKRKMCRTVDIVHSAMAVYGFEINYR
eukprot:2957165-Pyramimonas_sp.AAC.1